MPRVHKVLKARKANPQHNIAIGDTYYWWAFRIGRSSIKRYSKTYPTRSQLTMSEFYSSLYEHEDNAQAEANNLRNGSDPEDVASAIESIADEVRSLGEEQEEKRSGMEDAFPGGCPTMELLEGRTIRCEEIADELEQVASNIRGASGDDAEEEDCSECDGTGSIEGDEEGTENEKPCEACNGTGKVTPEDGMSEDKRSEFADEIDAVDWSAE